MWGGGHDNFSHNYSDGMDCSGSTSFALYKAGMWDGSHPPRTSGQFSDWGVSGQGDRVTVWYNAGHVFITFSGDYKGRFDTGGPGGGSGPRYREQGRSTAGFEAPHWSGT